MKRLLPVLGALVLVGAVVAVVVWQRPDAPAAPLPLKDFVVQYADRSESAGRGHLRGRDDRQGPARDAAVLVDGR